MAAFRAAFPESAVKGCYFHLCQSSLRRVQCVGLKAEYENNDDFRAFVRCLAAISHVPQGDVVSVFDLLVRDSPTVARIEEVTQYFEHTYVRGRRLRGRGDNYAPPLFSHDSWNHYDTASEGIARTTNT